MDPGFHLSTSDALLWLDRLPSASADLVMLDPGAPGRVVRSRAKAQPAVASFPVERLSTLLHEIHRVLRPGRVCWWICETAHLIAAARQAERHGFSLGAPLVWDRGEGALPRLGMALPLARGRARSPGGELVVAPRPDGAWPGELPEGLAQALIEAATEPGELVLDPFTGSGAVGVGAWVAGRRYLGCDVLGAAVERARARLVAAGAAEAGDEAELLRLEASDGAGANAPEPVAEATLIGVEGAHQLTMFADGPRLP